jgi:hypothetical protein
MMPSNAVNEVRVDARGVVVKTSARSDLDGELFFYRELAARAPRLGRLFPQLLAGSAARLELEFVAGTPLSRVFAEGRMRPRHIVAAVAALCELHAVGEDEVPLVASPAAAKRFLAEKTAARFRAPEFAGLSGAPAVLKLLLARLEEYEPTTVRVVHGDAWFANILLLDGGSGGGSGGWNGVSAAGPSAASSSTAGSRTAALRVGAGTEPEPGATACELKFVDMRGRLGSELTLNGDPVYDFAKLLQSLLGFDEAVFGFATVPPDYRSTLLTAYFALLRKRNVRPRDVLAVALCLMAGSVPFHERRLALWRLVSSLCGVL